MVNGKNDIVSFIINRINMIEKDDHIDEITLELGEKTTVKVMNKILSIVVNKKEISEQEFSLLSEKIKSINSKKNEEKNNNFKQNLKVESNIEHSKKKSVFDLELVILKSKNKDVVEPGKRYGNILVLEIEESEYDMAQKEYDRIEEMKNEDLKSVALYEFICKYYYKMDKFIEKNNERDSI